MKIQISANLIALSKEVPLYIIGGAVRNWFWKIDCTDIDICGPTTPDIVQQKAEKLGYKVININKHLGTLLLQINDEQYEYTTWRQDSYTSGHTPSKVEFVTDILSDALRRDFTINSIYYDINNDTFIDPTNKGLLDIKNKLLRTANNPEITLKDDGLRILRLIRFAVTYNLKINRNTLVSAKKNIYLLKNISKERMLRELQYIVIPSNSNVNFIKLFNYFGLYKYLFNSSIGEIKITNKTLKNNYNNLLPEAKKIGFYILCLQAYFGHSKAKNTHIEYTVDLILGHQGLKESKETIANTTLIYEIFQDVNSLYALQMFHTLNTICRNIINNLMGDELLNKEKEFILLNFPFSEKDLAITNEKLLEIKVPINSLSKFRKALYNLVLKNNIKNTPNEILIIAQKLHNELNNLQKEK